MGNVVIYKASAGAGKTYTLVYEYIKYLFAEMLDNSGFENGRVLYGENCHRRILAVTFTNKSTAEMKNRIIEALYRLSKDEHEGYRLLLLKDLSGKLDVTEVKVYAKRFLSEILQDYAGLRVQTIDAFFQQVVRSFARELNMASEYQVEMDANSVKSMAVDELLYSADKDKNLLNWLTDLVKNTIELYGKWNPESDIKKLADLLFSEQYMRLSDKFSVDFSSLASFVVSLNDEILKFQNEKKRLSSKMRHLIGLAGVDVSFFKKGTVSYVLNGEHEIKNNFLSVVNDGEKNLASKEKIKQIDIAQLIPIYDCLVEYYELISKKLSDYNTAQLIRSNLYVVGILNEIDKNVKLISKANNVVLISSTSEFINRIIGGSSTPFIYEKIGTTTDHFLIDEFQDTSDLQWSNFVPLLHESVDRGMESLIVGDVKQSIYRWRNGDWKILHDGVQREFGGQFVEKTLDSNFRSAPNVVAFNNYLYSKLSPRVDALMKGKLGRDLDFSVEEIYGSVEQKSKSPSDCGLGYARCEFIEKGSNSDYKELSMRHVIDEITTLLDSGYSYEDFSILVSKNDEAAFVAKMLDKAAIPFYSHSSTRLSSCEALNFVMSVIRYISRPFEPLNRALFYANYNKVVNDRVLTNEDFFAISRDGFDSEESWERTLFLSNKSCDADIVYLSFQRLKNYPLLRMVQNISQLFSLFEIENGVNQVFLQAFFDMVEDFQQKSGSDLNLFVDYWEQTGSKKDIPMAESVDAVNIITVHKSKGLEFNVVFVPFCDWMFDVSSNDRTVLMPLNDVSFSKNKSVYPLFPVNLNKHNLLRSTHFSAAFDFEYQNTCLDILNKFYVATTRAKHRLYVVFPNNDAVNSLSDMVASLVVADPLDDSHLFYDENGRLSYVEYGQKEEKRERKHSKKEIPYMISYPQASVGTVNLRTQLRYKYDDDGGGSRNLSQREYGIVMHRMLAAIATEADIPTAVDLALAEGRIAKDEVDFWQSKLNDIVSHEVCQSWFDGSCRVINEFDIINPKTKSILRPDRIMVDVAAKEAVVVDYKFGIPTKTSHLRYVRQVEEYLSLIHQMGYSARGVILYVQGMQVCPVG